MRIFNQIEELIKSAKSAKSSNELLSVGKELANLAEFQTLINFISDRLSLDEDDLRAWNLNFKEDPYTTVFCLKLMKKAINQGRVLSHGWLSHL
ncbi:hypothetical protein [Polynucleobacter rarus]|uniref:hypothetical protein n=1 Tax=Polynucleobacter rarus TaxID=556055 RepID=UPI000D3E838E|nr:hypothetical protein [Polynucleobacter rarus]